MSLVLAVDFGGTKTATALFDSAGRAANRAVEPSPHDPRDAVSLAASRAPGASAAGIVVPGIYDRTTGAAWAPNLWGWDPVPLKSEMEQRLGIPCYFDCDRTAYVLGEQWLGVARGLTDVVFVAIGTGIGAGILSGGRVLRGAHGIAGAVGWFALSPEWKEAYSRTGCWEAEAAGPAIALGAAPDRVAEFTAMGVANLISALDPEMVVLGGGALHSSIPLLDEVRQRVSRWAQPIALRRVRIELSELGDDAGLCGAARIALQPEGCHVGH